MIQLLKRFIRTIYNYVKEGASMGYTVDIASQDDLLLPMKYYRIRAIVEGRLYIETIEAKDLDSAFKILVKKAADGLLEIKEDVGFYQRKQVQITYEEVKDGASSTSAREIGSRTQMGKEGLTSQHEDMKWIDIKIKDVKKLGDNEINQDEKLSIAT